MLFHAEVAGSQQARETGFVERALIFPEYFRVAGFPLVAGREFSALDTARANLWPSWIVNLRAVISRARIRWASTAAGRNARRFAMAIRGRAHRQYQGDQSVR